MQISAEYSPPYSLALIVGSSKGTVPETIEGKLISATSDCIAVGCRAEYDGDTHFILGDKDTVDPGFPPLFSGWLETPSDIIMVNTVLGETILQAAAQGGRTAISVWANDAHEPDEIRIGIGQ